MVASVSRLQTNSKPPSTDRRAKRLKESSDSSLPQVGKASSGQSYVADDSIVPYVAVLGLIYQELLRTYDEPLSETLCLVGKIDSTCWECWACTTLLHHKIYHEHLFGCQSTLKSRLWPVVRIVPFRGLSLVLVRVLYTFWVQVGDFSS